jgi:hypothetical protein
VTYPVDDLPLEVEPPRAVRNLALRRHLQLDDARRHAPLLLVRLEP